MGVKKYNFSNDQIEDIINLHNDGLFNREIAEIYGVSNSTIARIIQNSGVQSRHPLLTDCRKREVCDLYLKGYQKSEIKRELHISTSTINTILEENGIEIDAFRVNRRYYFDYQYFDKIDTPNKAYVLGLLLSDGCVAGTGNAVTISLQEGDEDILEKINREIKNERPISYIDYYNRKNKNWKNHYKLSFNSAYTKSALSEYGCVPNKSLILQYPDSIPDELHKDLIRGYLDGDGSVLKKECRVQITSTLSFCESLKIIIENALNVHCSIMSQHGSSITSTLQIAGKNQCKKFLDWIYDGAELYLIRKHNTYLEKYCTA